MRPPTLLLVPAAIAVSFTACSSPVDVTSPRAVAGNLEALVPSTAAATLVLDFSACAPEDQPIWLAVQDGTGPWTRVMPTNGVASVRLDSATGGLATTGRQTLISQTLTTVVFESRAQLTAKPMVNCTQFGASSVSGVVAGLEGTDLAFVKLGGSSNGVTAVQPAFELDGVTSGVHDLFANRRNDQVAGRERLLIRRDVDVDATPSLGTIDFAGDESFAPETVHVTVAGAQLIGQVRSAMSYLTGPKCDIASIASEQHTFTGAGFPTLGVPAVRQQPGDLHQLAVNVGDNVVRRAAVDVFHTLTDRVAKMPTALKHLPLLSELPAPYKRLQLSFTLPSDYDLSSKFAYTDATTSTDRRSLSVMVTAAYVGHRRVTLTTPDFSLVDGWNNDWAPRATSTGTTSMVAIGQGHLSSVESSPSLCRDGAREVFITVAGTY
jgi:hypothetical protein